MNSKEDYFRAYKFFEEKYDKLGMNDFDYFYIYSDFRWFATEMGKNLTKNEFCSAVIKPLIEKNKTVIIPTYTYTVKGVFEVLETPTRLGALNSWILSQPSVKRSEHPIFSFAAIGSKSSLVENCGKSAFGKDSIHERLRGKKCCFINIGRPIEYGITLLHNVEQSCGASYRFHKTFKTRVFKENEYIGSGYTAFVRRRDVPSHDFKFNFLKASKMLYDAGIVNQVGEPTALTNVSLYDYDKTREILVRAFLNDPAIFLSKPFIQN